MTGGGLTNTVCPITAAWYRWISHSEDFRLFCHIITIYKGKCKDISTGGRMQYLEDGFSVVFLSDICYNALYMGKNKGVFLL